jgi:hypothetical protein
MADRVVWVQRMACCLDRFGQLSLREVNALDGASAGALDDHGQ